MDYSALPAFVELYGITDVDVLIHELVEIKRFADERQRD